MRAGGRFAAFRNVLVPVIDGCDPGPALAVARAVADERRIWLVGVVPVEPGRSLAAGAVPARRVRARITALLAGTRMRRRSPVRVSYTPWQDLVELVQTVRADLMLLAWPCGLEALRLEAASLLASPPCDVALVRGPLPPGPGRILLSVRGGPQAELALRLALAVGGTGRGRITVLHTRPAGTSLEEARRARAFRGLDRVLAGLPEVERLELEAEDPAAALVAAAGAYDLVIVGAAGQAPAAPTSLGPVADRLLHETGGSVIAVKARQPLAPETSRTVGQEAISVLVDKWFAENTYHAEEFADIERLLEIKRQRGLTISVALPALNEEQTVGNVIRTIKEPLMDRFPLIDEMVLIDSLSTDRTREIAESLGIPVYIHQEILPAYGPRRGKGEALWKSLYVTRGDLLFWIDTDIVNIHPRFVYGLVGPLLFDTRLRFVKGFYHRPLRENGKLKPGEGGRVTELTARPLLNLFFPELSGMIQPLAGEYGGWRSALEQVPFYTGYGVETGILIEVLERFGLSAIAQVDLQERIHRNQPLESLSKMSFAIIQVVMNKLERRFGSDFLEDINTSMKLIRYDANGFYLDVQEIIEEERPPMIQIPEYVARLSPRD